MTQATARVQPGRRQREAARRRADVLDVAADIFAEKGHEGAQISEIARVAEVSLATLYTMFDSKDELYQAVLTRAAESIRDTVRARLDVIDDPAERLLELIDCLLHCFDENRTLMRIYTMGTHGLPWSIRQTMGEPLVEIYRAFLDYVTGLARAAAHVGRLGALAPETVALALVGTVNATAAEWIESERDAPLTDAAPAIRALFEQLLVEADDS
jgi:AcrR family transcriptional regulator